MNANDIPDMEESELDFCRKAFEKIYPGAAKYRLSDGYSNLGVSSVWIDWHRSWKACRALYVLRLGEARLAQYDTQAKLHQANQRIIALKNENEKFRRALFAWVIAEKEGGHYSKAQELRDAALAALEQQESPEMKGPDLTGIERECCGTFHGTPHRSTCKNFNTKTRKRDPFYDDSGSGHDLAI